MAKATKMLRLEQWLTHNEVSHEDLAKQLGVSSPAIFHYIAGRNRPTADKLVKLSQITGISCSDLIAEVDERRRIRLEATRYPLV